MVNIRWCKGSYSSPPCQTNRLHTKFSTHTFAIMSFPQLPSQANPSHQQRTTHPPHALAPALVSSPQWTAVVRVQSVSALGQGAGDQPVICQHFAEVCTSTYKWVPIPASDVQMLHALNVPVHVVPSGMPSGVSTATSNGPTPRYVFKSSTTTSG